MDEINKHGEVESLSSGIISNLNFKKRKSEEKTVKDGSGKKEVDKSKVVKPIEKSKPAIIQSPKPIKRKERSRDDTEIDVVTTKPEFEVAEEKVRIVDNYNIVGKSKYDIIPSYFSYNPSGSLSSMNKEYLAANQTLLHTFYKKVERYANVEDPAYGKVLKEFIADYTGAQRALNKLYSNKGLIQLKTLNENEINAIFAKMIKHAKEVKAEKHLFMA